MPAPKGQHASQQDRSRASEQRVVAAAERVLVEVGLDRFSTARVAEKAGISAAMVYRRFAGKKELLAAVDADLQDRLNTKIAEALKVRDTSLGEMLHAFTAALAEVLAESGDVIPALLGSRANGAPHYALATTNALEELFLNAGVEHRADIRRANPIVALKISIHTVIAAAIHRAITTPNCPDGLTWQQWSDEVADMTAGYLTCSHHSQSLE